ncbi:hypothetical protein HDU85_005428 [Gaertneriomyces sp. JEL0708]|nr:hypothetical protein HDU85_005428 [Gaertneriomyces sp. JEL0708]
MMFQSTAPLVSSASYNARFQVRLCIHDALRPSIAYKQARIFEALSTLETLLASEAALSLTQMSDALDQQAAQERLKIIRDATERTERSFEHLVITGGIATDGLEYFKAHASLANFFPRIASRRGYVVSSSNGHSESYYAHLTSVATITTLVTLAQQLQADLTFPPHKYAAHQLAMLYQACNSVPAFQSLLGRIQEQFETVKSTVNTVGTLNEEQQRWLIGLTTDIINQCLAQSANSIQLVPGPFSSVVK